MSVIGTETLLLIVIVESETEKGLVLIQEAVYEPTRS
jgi:hypothetical protein